LRAVVQRVSRAAVSVDGFKIGEIGSGLAESERHPGSHGRISGLHES